MRAAVAAAEHQARELGHHAIAPAHLLLGLVVAVTARRLTGDQRAGRADAESLCATGLVLADLRDAVVRHADADLLAVSRPGDHCLRGGWGCPELPVTAQGRGVLQHALRRATPPDRAASRRGDRQLVTTAHLLLGVLDSADPVTVRALIEASVDTTELAHAAERVVNSAPWLDDTRPDPRDRIPVHIDDQGRVVISSFGSPPRHRLDGPAVHRVLARAQEIGKIDTDELRAAVAADDATRAEQDPPVPPDRGPMSPNSVRRESTGSRRGHRASEDNRSSTPKRRARAGDPG